MPPPLVKFLGWYPSLPDYRDRQFRFAATPAMIEALPESFDLDEPPLGEPYNPCWEQGTLGSCGPHSECANIVYDLLKLSGIAAMPSRLFCYYTARMLMNTVNDDSGVDNRSMLKALSKYGYCDEELWPYDISRFTERPPDACFTQALSRAGQIVYRGVPQSIDQMKAALFTLKRPIIFGFSVYESMMSATVDKSGDVPMPVSFADRQVGGHDVLLTGWSNITGRFNFKNSWSKNWGKAGRGSIPFQYAQDQDLAGDFWTVVSAGATVPPPVPPPPPPDPPPPSPTALFTLGFPDVQAGRKCSFRAPVQIPAGNYDFVPSRTVSTVVESDLPKRKPRRKK